MRGYRGRRASTHPDKPAYADSALAGDLVAELGYPPGVDEVPAEVAEVAARCARWWAERRSQTAHAVPSVPQP